MQPEEDHRGEGDAPRGDPTDRHRGGERERIGRRNARPQEPAAVEGLATERGHRDGTVYRHALPPRPPAEPCDAGGATSGARARSPLGTTSCVPRCPHERPDLRPLPTQESIERPRARRRPKSRSRGTTGHAWNVVDALRARAVRPTGPPAVGVGAVRSMDGAEAAGSPLACRRDRRDGTGKRGDRWRKVDTIGDVPRVGARGDGRERLDGTVGYRGDEDPHVPRGGRHDGASRRPHRDRRLGDLALDRLVTDASPPVHRLGGGGRQRRERDSSAST